MRCLYCGKHLPLLRKLTGGGEFCSDAHRDNYHDEYNRLAVSRLLQAQARPEEPKAATKATTTPAPAAVEERTAGVALAEQPEPDEIPGSYIEEFRLLPMSPVAIHLDMPIGVDPILDQSAGIIHPSSRTASGGPQFKAGYVTLYPDSRRGSTAEVEVEPTDGDALAEIMPFSVDRPPAEHQFAKHATFVVFQPSQRRGAALSVEIEPPITYLSDGILPLRSESSVNGHQVNELGRFLPLRPPLQRSARSTVEIEPLRSQSDENTLPNLPQLAGSAFELETGGIAIIRAPSIPRASKAEPLESGPCALEISQPEPLMPKTNIFLNDLGLPKAGSFELGLSPMTPAGADSLDIGIIESFSVLATERPVFHIEIKPLEIEGSDVRETPKRKKTNELKTEVIAITPRRVLEALSHLHPERKEKAAPEPPASRPVKSMIMPVIAPGAETLTVGFESAVFANKPGMMRYTVQPLRPKMAVGTAAGPAQPRSAGHTGGSNGHKIQVDGARSTMPKNMTRSMLHLEDEARISEQDTETPTLFGKLGGLFGKKSRTGKQEVGNQK